MRAFFLAVATASALAGCSSAADTQAAERGIAQFRRMMAAGEYRQIYATAAPDFRQTGSEANAVRFLETVATRLGPVRRSTQQGWNVNVGTAGRLVTLAYATEFARGRGAETFVYRVSGEAPKLVGYHINSMDLMTAGPAAPPAEEDAPVRR